MSDSFQGLDSGQGLLKKQQVGDITNQAPLADALKKKRQKLSETMLGSGGNENGSDNSDNSQS